MPFLSVSNSREIYRLLEITSRKEPKLYEWQYSGSEEIITLTQRQIRS